MIYPIETINHGLSLIVLAVQIASGALLALLFLYKKFPDLEDVAVFVGKWGLWAGFILTASGTALSLFYSEVLGFAPCGLCWIQRVFLYPQVLLFALAIWKRDRGIAIYSIALSVAGGIVALYQHYLQMGGQSLAPCPAVAAQASDCAQRFLFEFGYMTFPLMTVTLFAFLIVVMLFVRAREKINCISSHAPQMPRCIS